jgi:hypothetical protein
MNITKQLYPYRIYKLFAYALRKTMSCTMGRLNMVHNVKNVRDHPKNGITRPVEGQTLKLGPA